MESLHLHRCGYLRTTANLANVALGSGILALPYALAAGGYVWSMAFTALFLVLAIWTLHAIQCAVVHHAPNSLTYQDLLRAAFGKHAEMALAVLLLIKFYGTGIAYLIIIGDVIQPLMVAAGASGWLSSRTMVISVFAFAVMLPLCLFRTLRALSAASVFGVAAIGYVAAFVATDSIGTLLKEPIDHDVQTMSYSWGLLKPIGVVVFAFGCHVQSPQVFAEVAGNQTLLPDPTQDVLVISTSENGSLPTKHNSHSEFEAIATSDQKLQEDGLDELSLRDGHVLSREQQNSEGIENAKSLFKTQNGADTKSDRNGTKRMANCSRYSSSVHLSAEWQQYHAVRLSTMTAAIITTVSMSFVLQGSVAVLAYFKYGSDVASNVLNMYDATYLPAAIARVSMAVAVAFTYPLVHSTARYSLWSIVLALKHAWRRQREQYHRSDKNLSARNKLTSHHDRDNYEDACHDPLQFSSEISTPVTQVDSMKSILSPQSWHPVTARSSDNKECCSTAINKPADKRGLVQHDQLNEDEITFQALCPEKPREESQPPLPSLPAHTALTLLYVATTYIIAINISDVGVVFSILGSTAGVITNYLIPAVLVLHPKGHCRSFEAKMSGKDTHSAGPREDIFEVESIEFSTSEDKPLLRHRSADVGATAHTSYFAWCPSPISHFRWLFRGMLIDFHHMNFKQRGALIIALLIYFLSFPLIILGCITPFL